VGLVVPDPQARPPEDDLRPTISERISERIRQLNAGLSRFEQIRGFCVAPGPLTVEAGQLTPSFKVRRQAVWADFGRELVRLYDGGEDGRQETTRR